MKRMPKYKKSNLLTPQERERIAVDAAEKANLIITLCVLADCEGYGKVRINRFLENYKTLADSFKEGNENLMEINQTLWERFGIKIV
jgi:hypothetical protein